MAKKHHKFTHTTVTHHDDGSHTVKHHHEDGKSNKEYAVGDHAGMIDGMMDHTAPPASGGQAGPEAAAAPGAMASAAPAVVPGA